MKHTNMGVDGLTQLIKKKAPEAMVELPVTQFKGKTHSIDASGYFYRFCHDPINKGKKSNPHIDGFYQLFMKFLRAGVQPVVVLDGQAPALKKHTLQKRAQVKAKAINEVNKLQESLLELISDDFTVVDTVPSSPKNTNLQLDQILKLYKGHPLEAQILAKIDEIKKASKHVIHFQTSCYQDLYDLCAMMDIDIFRAKGEADALCVYLCQTGQAHGIVGEDADLILYGGQLLLRKVGWGQTAETIDRQVLLEKLGLSNDQFIDLCILCGTDYTVGKIEGIGAIRAYELVSQGLTIEQIIDKIQLSKSSNDKALKSFHKYTLPTDLSDFDYKSARELIKNAPSEETGVQLKSNWHPNAIQVDKLAQFMQQKCGYKLDTVPKHHQQLLDTYVTKEDLSQHAPKPIGSKIKLNLKPNALIKIPLKMKKPTLVN